MAKKGLILAIIVLGIAVSSLFYANYIQWHVGNLSREVWPPSEEMIMDSKRDATMMAQIVLSNAYGVEYTSFIVDEVIDDLNGRIACWHIRVDPEVYPGVTHEVYVEFSFYRIQFTRPRWSDHDCS